MGSNPTASAIEYRWFDPLAGMIARLLLAATLLSAIPAVAAEDASSGPVEAPRQSQPAPQRAAPAMPARPQMSDRCETWAANCILADRQPRGSSCWCVTPFGPSYGRVR